jgi:hypothetical protein
MNTRVLMKIMSRAMIVIALCLILGSACKGGEETPAPSGPSPSGPSTGGNQAPVISSLTAAQTSVAVSTQTEVRCVASDPDGDKITFTWATNGGSFSGSTSESFILWVAPEQYDDYNISVEVNDGKGGSVQSTVTITVGGNNNPVIRELVAKPATLGLGGSSVITCTATDPDSDPLTYTWSASDGDLTGVGKEISWIAPQKTGTFEITAVVNDNKGGQAKNNVLITVASALKTVTLTTIDEETGTVSPDNKDFSRIRAGDDSKETPYQAYWSYNIFGLNHTEIKEAKLIFGPSEIVGEPFTKVGSGSLGGLKLNQVKYGEGLPSYNFIGSSLARATAAMYTEPKIIDVTPEIDWLVKAGAKRFQVQALFGDPNNGNGISEYIEWEGITLEITYTEK